MTCSFSSCLGAASPMSYLLYAGGKNSYKPSAVHSTWSFRSGKAFDSVIGWAFCKLVVEEWLVRLIQCMYEHARSKVHVSRRLREDFSVNVGFHQSSCLSPHPLTPTLRFITVLKAPSQEFRTGCPRKKYEFDLVHRIWNAVGTASGTDSLEVSSEGTVLCVNMGKTKVLPDGPGLNMLQNSDNDPCAVCLADQYRRSQWEARNLTWCCPFATFGDCLFSGCGCALAFITMCCHICQIQRAAVHPHVPMICYCLQKKNLLFVRQGRHDPSYLNLSPNIIWSASPATQRTNFELKLSKRSTHLLVTYLHDIDPFMLSANFFVWSNWTSTCNNFQGYLCCLNQTKPIDIARTVTEYEAYPHVAKLSKTKLDPH